MMTLEKAKASLDNLVEIQTRVGTYDFSEYMRGLANGLLLAKHVVHNSPGVPVYI